jgi:hypothetical protein
MSPICTRPQGDGREVRQGVRAGSAAASPVRSGCEFRRVACELGMPVHRLAYEVPTLPFIRQRQDSCSVRRLGVFAEWLGMWEAQRRLGASVVEWEVRPWRQSSPSGLTAPYRVGYMWIIFWIRMRRNGAAGRHPSMWVSCGWRTGGGGAWAGGGGEWGFLTAPFQAFCSLEGLDPRCSCPEGTLTIIGAFGIGGSVPCCAGEVIVLARARGSRAPAREPSGVTLRLGPELRAC